MYEILWCYNSSETSLTVQSYTVVLFISYVVLTFESVDENLLSYHSTETSFADLLHSTICFLGCYKIKTYCFFLESFYFGQFYQTERVLKVSEMKSKYLENWKLTCTWEPNLTTKRSFTWQLEDRPRRTTIFSAKRGVVHNITKGHKLNMFAHKRFVLTYHSPVRICWPEVQPVHSYHTQ